LSRPTPRGLGRWRSIRLTIPAAIAASFLLSAATASAAIDSHITLAGNGTGAVLAGDPEAGGTPPIDCSNIPGAEKTVCDTEGFSPHPVFGPTLAVKQEAAPGSIFAGWTVEAGEGILCPPQGVECIAVAEPGAEISLKATFVDAVALSLVKGGHAAGGTVTSDPVGIDCDAACEADTAEYAPGQTVELEAEAAPGYVFAGWLGCTNSGPGACQVTLADSDTQVFAIFLKDGIEGPTGPTGPGGPTGPTGPTGPEGSPGSTGPEGPNGPGGPSGPSGPQGPAGQKGADGAAGGQGPAGSPGAPGGPGPTGKRGPAGRVICQVHQKGERVNVTCKVREAAGSASKRRAPWRLVRGGRTYAQGAAEVRHGGSATVRLPTQALADGGYVLRFQGQKGVHIVVG
jgi:hypothetical protein